MCDFSGAANGLDGRPAGATDVSDAEGAITGELMVTKEDGSVELQVNGAGLDKPRIYAFEAAESVAKFTKQLASDLGVEAASVEVRTPSGAVLNTSMSHAFAWKPGRIVAAGERSFRVSFVTASGDGEIDHFSPAVSGRRSSVRVASPAVMKYVVVSGGVVSGLGKGVTASSLGVLMRAAGYRVTSIKIDPYLNVDAGTMSPFEHGEVFTLDDGGEVCATPPHHLTSPHLTSPHLTSPRLASPHLTSPRLTAG
jgi:hypothetical protein